MSHNLWLEFGAVALAHGLAVASPGPDFALMVRQSLRHGRATAIRTAIGIGCGITVHVALALLGLTLLIRNSPTAFAVLKVCGGAYLIWLGWLALRSGGSSELTPEPEVRGKSAQRGSWRRGFLTNVLNPKAALFFVTLYTVLVSPETPRSVQAGYGLWMVVWTAAWFSLVAVLFTQAALRQSYLRASKWIDRALGLVFWGFAVNLFFAKLG